MASTYTTFLGVEKPGNGEQSGTWGTTANTNYDLIDEAIVGQTAITLTASHTTSGTPYSLAITDGLSSDGRNKFIDITDGGDIGGSGYVQLSPNNAEKVCYIRNSLSGSQSCFLFQGTYNAANDYELANGKTVIAKFDGAGSGAVVTILTPIGDVGPSNNVAITGGTATLTSATITTATITALGAALSAGSFKITSLATPTASTDAANKAYVDAAIPIGGIIMWSGSVASIPSGWQICDGTNGTPNLTGKFIVHADADTGGTYNPGNTGGADSVTLTTAQMPSHTHSAGSLSTSTAGNHQHDTFNNAQSNTTTGGAANRVTGLTNTAGSGTSGKTDANGDHTHTISGVTGAQGSSTSHENRPPYYALAFIQRLS